MEKLEQTLALSEDNERPNWIGGIVDALDDAKSTLDVIDSSGALPSSWKKLVTRDDTRRKNSILHLWQEKTHESLKDSLRDGSQVNAIRLKTIECIESARARWRAIESIQGGLDFTSFKAIDDDNRVDATGFRGANYITDAALPVVLRLALAQPIVAGEGEEKFTFAERMGFQSLWEHRRSGHWGTRRRHDAVMRIFGATMNKLLSGGKMCVFEKDADFSRSCFVEGGKKHRPDMVIDNAFDDNVKIVFDLTNQAPLTRHGTNILAVDNHLESAEEKKRNSPAWANFVPLDGLTSEFVPFAIGWYGEIGGEAMSFIRRIVGHYVRDERTAAWGSHGTQGEWILENALLRHQLCQSFCCLSPSSSISVGYRCVFHDRRRRCPRGNAADDTQLTCQRSVQDRKQVGQHRHLGGDSKCHEYKWSHRFGG
jgi:hypothetical protein